MWGRQPRPAEPRGSVHEAALRLVARRAYSTRELRERLEARGFDTAAARAEVVRLEAAGLLDDGQLASSVVRNQIARGRGKRSAAVELRRRGVGKEEREAVLGGLEPEDEAAALARAVDAATRRHPGWSELLQVRRKVIRYLLARGFDPGQVRDALAERTEADHGEHDADNLGDP
jgi:regulatory protein